MDLYFVLSLSRLFLLLLDFLLMSTVLTESPEPDFGSDEEQGDVEFFGMKAGPNPATTFALPITFPPVRPPISTLPSCDLQHRATISAMISQSEAAQAARNAVVKQEVKKETTKFKKEG